MKKKSKIQTIGYIFLHTVVLQLIVISIFSFVAFLAYFGLTKYNSSVLALVGVIAFIDMMFVFVCVSVFKKSYGVSLFAQTRREFDGTAYKGETIKRIDYSLGRKNVFTGERSIYVREREVKPGGAIIALGIPAIVSGFTGIFKFIIESIRVVCSEDRQAAWEEGRAYLDEKINKEGKRSFFKVPRICCFVLALSMVISLPVVGFNGYRFNPDRVNFCITQKENYTDKYGRAQIIFSASLENTGSASIRHIQGYLIFRDQNEQELYREKVTVKSPGLVTSGEDDYLDQGEQWELELYPSLSPEALSVLWNTELSDIEILMEVTEIRYAGHMFSDDTSIDFPNTPLILKPLS